MRCLSKIAILMSVIMIVSCFSIGGVNVSAAGDKPQWDQAIIDKAVAASLSTVNTGDRNGGPAFGLDGKDWRGTSLIACEVMAFLALVAYYNPEAKATNGKKVVDRLVDHINRITRSDSAPACRGGLGGWVDGPVAQALALAKNNPAVWNKLSTDVKNRCDFIMKVMALTGNYTQNYRNNPVSDMSQHVWWSKGWNPNHQEGYIGVMIAAYYYFGGADAVNAILTGFDYDTYIQQMQDYGYDIMRGYYQKAGKQLLENGGQDINERGERGTLVGVKIPFTFKGIDESGNAIEVPYDPVKIYQSAVRRMYGRTVESHIYDKGVLKGYINKKDGSGNYISSPYEGMLGMGTEFKSSDANGLRTDAGYIDFGWRNSVPTRATIEALGGWKGEGINQAESRMYVGSEDFLFKTDPANGGYIGWQKGKASGPTTQDSFKHGFEYYKQTWQKFLKRETGFEPKLVKNGNNVSVTVRGYNFNFNSSKNIVVIMAEYDQNKLVSIETKNITVNKLTESKVLLNTSKTLSKQNNNLKLFIWDSVNGMQPLSDPASTN